MTDSMELTAEDRAIAAWESAAVQTLNPILDSNTATAMWTAMLEHRTTQDVGAFATGARALVASSSPSVRHLVDVVIENLTAVRRAFAAAQD